MVDWSKEISFRRKPKPPQPEADVSAAAPEPAPEADPVAEKTSVWKKEISFRRKPKAAKAVPPASVPAEELEPFEAAEVPDDDWLFAAAPIEEPEPEREPEPEAAVAAAPLEEAVPEPEPEPEPPAVHVLEPDPLFAPPEEEPEHDLVPAAEADLEPVGAAFAQPEPDDLFLPAADDEAAARYFPPVEAVEAVEPEEPRDELEPPADAEIGWPEAAELIAALGPDTEPENAPTEVFVPALPELLGEVEPAPVEEPAAEAELAEPPTPVSVEASDDERPAPPSGHERPPLVKRALDFRRRGAGGPARGGKRLKSIDDAAQKAKKVVGLKIGASQISAARVSNNGHVEVLQLAREPLEQGIVVGGELRDPEALATALRTFFRKNRLPRRNVRLGISNNRIGVRIFEISGIEDTAQLKNAIRFRAQETLPIPLDEAVLDYQIVGEWKSEDGMRTRRVLLVVAYRELVDRYVAACRKAGIRLMGIDLEAFGLLRALAVREEQPSSDERAALVVVSIGHDRTTLAVSDGRVCEYTRVLDWGGFSISVAIARVLDLTPSEAEPIKLALSLVDPSAVPSHLDEEKAKDVQDAVARQLETFARDLVSSLRFYQNQPGSLGIGEIVLTGGTAALPGLAEELERLIGVNVRVGDPLAHLRTSRKVTGRKSKHPIGSVAAAIGLGMEV